MYQPSAFKVEDEADAFGLIAAHSFGQLVSTVQGRLFATHLPFLLRPEKRALFAHVARANPQWRDINGQEVLLIFSGDHEYVSPGWYVNSGVPTWNYEVVHVYARATVIEDERELREVVDGLTHQHEQTRLQPWQPEYPEAMLKGIVGLRFAITEVQGKSKLSQNRSVSDQKKVAEQFDELGQNALAAKMRKRLDY